VRTDFVFTSESVTEGHPDKMCDQISDAIVDRFLEGDPFSRVVAECAVATGVVFIDTRFASRTAVDIPNIARQVINQVGYQHGEFNATDCTIMTNLGELPSRDYPTQDERQLDDTELDRIVVKNQVTVFGFACNQTTALMPLPIWLAHRLARRLAAVRLERHLPYLMPDGKTQVAVEYRDHRPHRIYSITLIASQHPADGPALQKLHDDLYEHVIVPVFAQEKIRPDERTLINVNPDGPVIGGGPTLHAGLTGRKNAIDTYGEYARRSGSALCGKDPMRIDRVGAYAARHAAKNIVAAGLAEECEVQLSYSIGIAHPVSIQVETFGTGTLDDAEITRRVAETCDFRLGGIIKRFDLRHLPATRKGGFYRKLAAYGQFGRMDMGLPWEQTDLGPVLRG
jgi:S-adenosylmethionine synthetase